MRFRSREYFASVHTVPIRQAGIKRTADNDICQRPVVGMDAVTLSSEDQARTMLSDQTGNSQTGRDRVPKQAIALSEYQAFNTKYLRCASRIFPPASLWRIPSGFAIGQVNK